MTTKKTIQNTKDEFKNITFKFLFKKVKNGEFSCGKEPIKISDLNLEKLVNVVLNKNFIDRVIKTSIHIVNSYYTGFYEQINEGKFRDYCHKIYQFSLILTNYLKEHKEECRKFGIEIDNNAQNVLSFNEAMISYNDALPLSKVAYAIKILKINPQKKVVFYEFYKNLYDKKLFLNHVRKLERNRKRKEFVSKYSEIKKKYSLLKIFIESEVIEPGNSGNWNFLEEEFLQTIKKEPNEFKVVDFYSETHGGGDSYFALDMGALFIDEKNRVGYERSLTLCRNC